MAVEIQNLTGWERLKLVLLCMALFPSWVLSKVLPLPTGHPWRAHMHYGLVEWTVRAGEFKLKLSCGLGSALALIGVAVVDEVYGTAAPSYMPLLAIVLTLTCGYFCLGVYLDMERRWAREAERRGD